MIKQMVVKLTILILTLSSLIVSISCDFNISNCSEFYAEVCTTKDYKLRKKFCDNGAFGDSFMGVSVSHDSESFDFKIQGHEALDSIYFESDTIVFAMKKSNRDLVGTFRDTLFSIKFKSKEMNVVQKIID